MRQFFNTEHYVWVPENTKWAKKIALKQFLHPIMAYAGSQESSYV